MKCCIIYTARARSSVGRVLHSHCRGRGFDSLRVHQAEPGRNSRSGLGFFFYRFACVWGGHLLSISHTCGEQFAHRRLFLCIKNKNKPPKSYCFRRFWSAREGSNLQSSESESDALAIVLRADVKFHYFLFYYLKSIVVNEDLCYNQKKSKRK